MMMNVVDDVVKKGKLLSRLTIERKFSEKKERGTQTADVAFKLVIQMNFCSTSDVVKHKPITINKQISRNALRLFIHFYF